MIIHENKLINIFVAYFIGDSLKINVQLLNAIKPLKEHLIVTVCDKSIHGATHKYVYTNSILKYQQQQRQKKTDGKISATKQVNTKETNSDSE